VWREGDAVAFWKTRRAGSVSNIRSSPVKLHAFWDGLLGNGTTVGAINSDVREIEALLKEKAADIQKEIDAHQTFESWGREGQELARRVVYLDGELKVAASSARRIAANADVPTAPDGYAQNCGKVARVQVGKIGRRDNPRLPPFVISSEAQMNEGQQPAMDPTSQVKLLREEIRFEHKLIANRLTVLLTGQPFLLTAFAIAARVEEPHRRHFLWFSYGIVPVIGLVIALVAYLAVREGEQRLGKLRELLYDDPALARLANKVCPPLDPRAQKRSLYYAKALPVVFGLAWVYVAGMGIWLLSQ
jgi:hypothetical protein